MRPLRSARLLAAAATAAIATVAATVAATGCSTAIDPADGPHRCNPGCSPSTVCRYGACIPPPSRCTDHLDCVGDQYCDASAGECLPWGIGPGGDSDAACKREPLPGVFAPVTQCTWAGPPAGDPFPGHIHVLATPMVAALYGSGPGATPSIVFTSYNYTDAGGESCVGTSPTSYFGVIRIIDGATCTQQASIAVPSVIASASVAIADLGGDATPEIVAARIDGGLVAFTRRPTGWQVMWQTASHFADNLCDWAGPSIHDLDDDGSPEIVFYGAVYDAAGNALDESRAGVVDSIGTGYLPVLADVDGDGRVELVSGSQVYSWEPVMRRGRPLQALASANGHAAVADFGTFPQTGPDARAELDGVAEIAVVHAGAIKVFNAYGREVFAAALTAPGGGPVGQGGPPVAADFDGDGRVELGVAGARAYHVFDPDCRGTPSAATCAGLRTDGIGWITRAEDAAAGTTGSSAFDFDGDGRAEVVAGDECFTRILDGQTGTALYARHRTACPRYEAPIVADADGDFNAELITTSSPGCGGTCPALDPSFDGLRCAGDADCPAATSCGREQPGDAIGRCRCTVDLDCGGDGLVCVDPIAGVSPAGRVCRASHPAAAVSTGVRVLADRADRWVGARPIWNQHAYSVTNIDGAGRVPRTRQWARNWTEAGLNNFRQGAHGDGLAPRAVADLTMKRAAAACEAGGGAVVTAEVCNRGTEPVAAGVPVAVYAAGTPATVRCTAVTGARLFPAVCTEVSCTWSGAGGDGFVAVDDRGDGRGRGTALECREDNNQLPLRVDCP